jgi:hypothetical protein
MLSTNNMARRSVNTCGSGTLDLLWRQDLSFTAIALESRFLKPGEVNTAFSMSMASQGEFRANKS